MKPFPFAIWPNTLKKSGIPDISHLFRFLPGLAKQVDDENPRKYNAHANSSFIAPIIQNIWQKSFLGITKGLRSGMILPVQLNPGTHQDDVVGATGSIHPRVLSQLFGLPENHVPVTQIEDRLFVRMNHQLADGRSIPLTFYTSSGLAQKDSVRPGEWYFVPGMTTNWFGKYTSPDAKYFSDLPYHQRNKNGMENSYGNPVLAYYKNWLDTNLGDLRGTSDPLPLTGDTSLTQRSLNRIATKFVFPDISYTGDYYPKMFNGVINKIFPLKTLNESFGPREEGVVENFLDPMIAHYHTLLNDNSAANPEVDAHRIPGTAHTKYGSPMNPAAFEKISPLLRGSSSEGFNWGDDHQSFVWALHEYSAAKTGLKNNSGDTEKIDAFARTKEKVRDLWPKIRDTGFGRKIREFTGAISGPSPLVSQRVEYSPEQHSQLGRVADELGPALYGHYPTAPKGERGNAWKNVTSNPNRDAHDRLSLVHAQLPSFLD